MQPKTVPRDRLKLNIPPYEAEELLVDGVLFRSYETQDGMLPFDAVHFEGRLPYQCRKGSGRSFGNGARGSKDKGGPAL